MSETSMTATAPAPAATTSSRGSSRGSARNWTLARLFRELASLGPLRVISVTPGSTFEAICEVGSFGIAHGHLNAITEAYHWHLDLQRLRYLRSVSEVHARSGREVLYFELKESAEAQASLWIYLYRRPKEGFGDLREARFAVLHVELMAGVELDPAAEDAP